MVVTPTKTLISNENVRLEQIWNKISESKWKKNMRFCKKKIVCMNITKYNNLFHYLHTLNHLCICDVLTLIYCRQNLSNHAKWTFLLWPIWFVNQVSSAPVMSSNLSWFPVTSWYEWAWWILVFSKPFVLKWLGECPNQLDNSFPLLWQISVRWYQLFWLLIGAGPTNR